jgi:uncharacterized protein YwqG
VDTKTIEKALTAAGLGRFAHVASQLALPSIRLRATLTEESEIPLGASKLGGRPDLPPHAVWPMLNTAPMSFVAQIRLSDLRKSDSARLLPATGLLSFFYDAQQEAYGDKPADRAGWQVLYHDGAPVPAQLERLEMPEGLLEEARFKACLLTPIAELTLPERPTVEAPSLMWNSADQERYETLYARFPSDADHSEIHHRMLGHPNTLQDDMRPQCQLVSQGVTKSDSPQAADLLKGLLNWLLLLQVDSDENAGMRWGNTGMLYFWIEREALAARQFDHVWTILQSE